MFTGYHIDGLCFDPPNLKNLAFIGIKGEKVIFLRILIIGSPITIPFLPTTFNIYIWDVHVIFLFYQNDGLHFDSPNPKN